MNTQQLMESAESLTMMMALRDGPRNAEDQLAIAQINVLLAIAQELKRGNDERETDSHMQEMVNLYKIG